jgi:FeS assembly protein IscX
LYWDASFAVAQRLEGAHPGVDLSTVTLNMVYAWVLALPEFADDPQLVNDDLLEAIFQDWYEAKNPL